MLLLSAVIFCSALPIIKSLYVIEKNTRILQQDTAELLSKAKKCELIYNRFEKIYEKFMKIS